MLEGFQPISVDVFGSLVTLIDRSDLPVNLSPGCQNVEFFPGGVKSRVGLKRYALTTGRIMNITGYVSGPDIGIEGVRYRIGITDTGLLIQDNGGMWTTIKSGIGRNSATYPYRMKATQFGDRLFMAFSDGRYPTCQALQYNGVYLDPVSQGGPCSFPNVTFYGGGSGGFSGGSHRYTFVFETRSGYLTAPPEHFTATMTCADHDTGYFSYFPIGPANTVRRRLYISPAVSTVTDINQDCSWKMYTHPSLWINDNTSTTFGTFGVGGIGVDDQTLVSYNDVLNPDDLGFIKPLPPVGGVATYSSRLVAWAIMNEFHRVVSPGNSTMALIPGNLDFDGGAGATPWTPPPWAHWSGAGSVYTDITAITDAQVSGTVGWGVKVTGTGSAAAAVMSHEKPIKNFLEVFSAKLFCFRIRAKRSPTYVAGSAVKLRVEALNASGSTPMEYSMSTLTEDYEWYSGVLCTPAQASGATPATLKVSVTSSGTHMSASQWIAWDKIVIFPQEYPYFESRLMVSQPNDPETFIWGNCEIPVNERDGQPIMNAYELRGILRVAKSESLYSVLDTGDTPDTWTVERASSTVGCMSFWGVGMGENWAVLADEDGLYLDDGGSLTKLSQEIQPDWDRISPLQAHRTKVTVDTQKKRIYVLAQSTTGTRPDTLFVMDYVEGLGDPLESGGHGRKWTVWTTPNLEDVAYLMGLDSHSKVYFVGGVDQTAGYALLQDSTGAATYDEYYDSSNKTLAYTSYYDTASIGQDTGRCLFGYLSIKARGKGEIKISTIDPSGTERIQVTRAFGLDGRHDIEIPIQQTETQIGLRLKTSGLYDSFTCRRLSIFAKSAPFTRMRGHNK